MIVRKLKEKEGNTVDCYIKHNTCEKIPYNTLQYLTIPTIPTLPYTYVVVTNTCTVIRFVTQGPEAVAFRAK